MSVAHDDAADRERIRTDAGANLFVEAGAGTGKTHELVGRVVELVVTGALPDVRGLAAITFTEKAATELRDRIRRGLEHAASADDDGDRRGRARTALEHLDDAAIGTLHGFALRILSEFPIEAGLPPGFELADPVAAAVDFNERWARFVDDLFATAALEPLLRRGFAMRLRLDSLREVALEFHEHWDRLAEDVPPASLVMPRIEPGAVVDALAACVADAEECELNDKLAARVLEDVPPYLVRLRMATEVYDEPSLLTLLVEDVPYLKAGSLGAKSAQVDELRAKLKVAEQVVVDTVADLRRGILRPLLDRLRAFTLDGAAQRQREGRLEFADLLVHAVRVLENDETVRVDLGRRWPVVLVDEFQDTDPLQIRIATLLTLADPTTVPSRWEDAVCASGRLFVVGDPKQSIYRFRRADIALYDRAKDLFGDGAVQLTRNFRTVPAILDWVNAVFGRVFGEGIREKQPEYRALVAARPPNDRGGSPVVVLGGPRARSRVSEVRETEARHLASYIASVVRDGEPATGRSGQVRPARYDDIAILLPTRTSLSEIERALDAADVPYRIESRSLVFGSDEVRELLTILQAVDHPGDAVALVGALRTPAFGCADRDLAAYRWAHGPWSVRFAPPDDIDPANPVPAAIAAIGRYHEMRQWLPVNELVERIIRERGMVELTLARPRPRDHWRRYRLLLDEARAFVAGGGVSLGEFVGWAEQQAEEGATRVESIVPESDDEAVRILTIHAAKGLEFPIAVLAGLNGQVYQRNSRVLWPADANGRPEVLVGTKAAPFETEGYRAAAEFESGMDELERQRLLYVAATRARDKLVVSLHHKERTACHASMLWEQTRELEHLVEWQTVDDEPEADGAATEAAVAVAAAAAVAAGAADTAVAGPVDERPELTPVVASEAMAERISAWDERRRTLLARAERPWAQAPSGIAPPSDDELIRRPGRRGRAGTSVGRAVHAVLQVIDLADPVDLDAVAEVQASIEGLPDRAATIARLARSLVDSPTVQQAVKGRYWRELFVAAPVDRPGSTDGEAAGLIEGYVDLLYETAEGEIVVVDYKTDQARTDDELDESVEHYRWQGAAYSLAVERALGRSVSRCVFVFARAEGAVERTIDDLASAQADVLGRLDP